MFVKRFDKASRRGHLLLTVGAKLHSFVSLGTSLEMNPNVPFGMITKM